MDKSKTTIPARPALGKGLASLFPNISNNTVNQTTATAQIAGAPKAISAEADISKDRVMGISVCSVEDIFPNPYQPRREFTQKNLEELAASIKESGIIQPLIVRKNAENKFQLIAGERRLRAAKIAGLKQVPVVVKRITDREALELAIVENIQREDLNCIDEALAYQQLMKEFNLTQEAVAQKVGKERASVANHLRLLHLPVFVQKALKDQTLSFGHGRALAALEDKILLEKVAKLVIENRWSVRETESQIQKIKANKESSSEVLVPNREEGAIEMRLKNLSKELTKKYATKVSISGSESKGKLVIEYFSGQDLNRILDQLLK